MCDEFTAHDDDAKLEAGRLSRREFAAVGAVGLLASYAGGAMAGTDRKILVNAVTVTTSDGKADALFIRPARGKYPGVIMWPDIAGLRDAYRDMAIRVAQEGYSVLVVNHYYRAAKAPLLASMSEWRSPAGQEKLKPAIASLSVAGTLRDAKAFVDWLDKQKSVDKKRRIGTQGYCQTGSFAIRTAAALPDRIGVAGSFHGGGLVTQAADSPHRLFAQSRASFLIAIGRNDDARAPGDKDALREAAKAADRAVEVEVYNADHGWCTLDSPSYDKAEADRARTRLFELYKLL